MAVIDWWASYSCCNFLCVVLATAYLKYRRYRLSCLPFVWYFFSLWQTHSIALKGSTSSDRNGTNSTVDLLTNPATKRSTRVRLKTLTQRQRRPSDAWHVQTQVDGPGEDVACSSRRPAAGGEGRWQRRTVDHPDHTMSSPTSPWPTPRT